MLVASFTRAAFILGKYRVVIHWTKMGGKDSRRLGSLTKTETALESCRTSTRFKN